MPLLTGFIQTAEQVHLRLHYAACCPQMAPNLSASQHAQIRDMIDDGRFTNLQIAKVNHCSKGAVKTIRRNPPDFGSTTAPPNCGGRPPSMTPATRDALLEYLLRKPNLYLDEMAIYLQDDSDIISQSPVSAGLCDL